MVLLVQVSCSVLMKIIGYPCKRHKARIKGFSIELPELLPPAPHKNKTKQSKERKKQLYALYSVPMNALRGKFSKLASDQCDPVNCHSYPTLTFRTGPSVKTLVSGPEGTAASLPVGAGHRVMCVNKCKRTLTAMFWSSGSFQNEYDCIIMYLYRPET